MTKIRKLGLMAGGTLFLAWPGTGKDEKTVRPSLSTEAVVTPY
jgi:hypothetical protein